MNLISGMFSSILFSMTNLCLCVILWIQKGKRVVIMKQLSRVGLFLILCTTFLFMACGTEGTSSPSGEGSSAWIVGTWISDDDTVVSVFDFNADNTVEMRFAYPDDDLYVVERGTWSADEVEMQMAITITEGIANDDWEIEYDSDSVVIDYRFSGSHLILSQSDAAEDTYDADIDTYDLTPASEGTVPVDGFWGYFD